MWKYANVCLVCLLGFIDFLSVVKGCFKGGWFDGQQAEGRQVFITR